MLAIGSAQFGLNYGIANKSGKVGLKEMRSILSLAKENGIDTIDTAIGYGESEANLGNIGVHDWKLVTKIPLLPDNMGPKKVKEWIDAQIANSLKKLNVESLYGVLLHSPDQLNNEKYIDIWNALEINRHAGNVIKIGYSIYDSNQIENIFENFKPTLVQVPFNIIDQRIKNNKWLDNFYNNEVEVHSRSCFLQGLLLMNKSLRPKKFNKWNSFWESYDEWLDNNNLSALEACLKYSINEKKISKTVVGVDNLQQIREIIEVTKSDKKIEFIDFGVKDINLINPVNW